MQGELKKAVWTLMLVLSVSAAMPGAVRAQDAASGRKVTKRVSPVYPAVARKAQLMGVVKVSLTVAPDGTVKAAKTVGGNALFVAAAEAAVKQWTFEPSKAETSEVVAVQFSPVM
jgi:TonB family protein